ncbi:MAG: hypothetical protein ACREJ0_30790 [Geminicoccaceae bacterium]
MRALITPRGLIGLMLVTLLAVTDPGLMSTMHGTVGKHSAGQLPASNR